MGRYSTKRNAIRSDAEDILREILMRLEEVQTDIEELKARISSRDLADDPLAAYTDHPRNLFQQVAYEAWNLTPIEADLIETLFASTTYLSSNQIVEKMKSANKWKKSSANTISVFVYNIRSKAGKDVIVNIHSRGYQLGEQARSQLAALLEARNEQAP